MTDFKLLRSQMVKHQIAVKGIKSKALLAALKTVPREKFVPANLKKFSYEDTPLPIGEGQTISQPYIVALMIETLNLKGGGKVLEIGTGSGYAAAVLSLIVDKVYTVERIEQIASNAAATIKSLGYKNIHVLKGDGTLGWKKHAPYDAIVVAAGSPSIPNILKEQLKIGGCLVIPIGNHKHLQKLVKVSRISESEYTEEHIADVGFVPLIGKQGWQSGHISTELSKQAQKNLSMAD